LYDDASGIFSTDIFHDIAKSFGELHQGNTRLERLDSIGITLNGNAGEYKSILGTSLIGATRSGPEKAKR
jgi:hypothetical protein